MQVFTLLMEFKRVAVRISKEVKQRRDQLLSQRICLVCEQKYEGATRRGECHTCRQFTIRMVERGEASENDLIRDGKLTELPEKKKGGRKAHSKRQQLRAT
jgi:hypothetical protein